MINLDKLTSTKMEGCLRDVFSSAVAKGWPEDLYELWTISARITWEANYKYQLLKTPDINFDKEIPDVIIWDPRKISGHFN